MSLHTQLAGIYLWVENSDLLKVREELRQLPGLKYGMGAVSKEEDGFYYQEDNGVLFTVRLDRSTVPEEGNYVHFRYTSRITEEHIKDKIMKDTVEKAKDVLQPTRITNCYGEEVTLDDFFDD